MAESLHFGVLVIGKGKVWIDQFKIEEVFIKAEEVKH